MTPGHFRPNVVASRMEKLYELMLVAAEAEEEVGAHGQADALGIRRGSQSTNMMYEDFRRGELGAHTRSSNIGDSNAERVV